MIFFAASIPIAAAALVFSDIVNHEFLRWDDHAYIVENSNIQQFGLANLRWALLDYYYHNWHPLTWLVIMLEYGLWGANAFLFKLVNIGLHILNSYLVMLLSYRIMQILYPAPAAAEDERRRWLACLVAGIFFTIHPLHVESVVWISELKDVLCGLFYFAALLAYINFRQSQNDTRWRNLTGLFFLCALMSKSMAVTLPAVLIVMDIFLFQRLTRGNWRLDLLRLIREKLLYFIISASISALTLISQTTESLESTGMSTRLINAIESVPFYLGQFLLPLKLSPVYPFSNMSLEPGAHSLIPLALLVVSLVAAWAIDKFAIRGTVFAMAFFLVSILPVIGLVKVGEQAAADRYTYIPLSMFFVVFACGMFRLLEFSSQRRAVDGLSLGLVLIVLSAYAWQARSYVPVWRSDETLWLHVNRQYPMRVVIAYVNLGNIENRKGNHEAALRYYESALEIDSGHVSALINRANANVKLGNHDLAVSLFSELTAMHPDSLLAHNMSAIALRRLDRLELSAKYFHRAYQLAPGSQLQLYESAVGDYMVGNNDRASSKLESLLRINQQHRQGRILNVALLFARGLSTEANMQLEALQREFPNDPQIREIYDQLQNQQAE